MPGPYVQLATICERVLQESTGVLSVIRAIDRFIVTAHGQGAPPELPQGALGVTLVITLKSDDARGRHPVILRIQQPNGVTLPERSFDVVFEGEERGVNLLLELEIEVLEGLYWFDVFVNDQLLTRVPLRIMYQRIESGP